MIRLRAPKRPQAVRIAPPMPREEAQQLSRLLQRSNYHVAPKAR